MGRWFYVWAKQRCEGSRQKLLFIPQHDNWRVDSQSVVTLYEHIWGFGGWNCKGIKRNTALCSFFVVFFFFSNIFLICFHCRLYLQWKTNVFYLAAWQRECHFGSLWETASMFAVEWCVGCMYTNKQSKREEVSYCCAFHFPETNVQSLTRQF